MRTYNVISSDSHVVEAHDLWTNRVSAKYRDRAPHLLREETTDRLVCEDINLPAVGLLAGYKRGSGEQRFEGRWEECVPRGGYDSDARLEEIAVDGVDAEVLFPTLGMPMFAIKDLDFRWELFRAYNSWLAEEYCAPHKDTFFGLAMIDPENLDRAVAEIKRARELGLVGIMLPLYRSEENPYYDHSFDPLWAAAVEHQMPVNLHQVTSKKSQADVVRTRPLSPGELMADEQTIQGLLVDMISFGVFDRFPELYVVSAENDAGWAGHLIEKTDYYRSRLAPALRGATSAKDPEHYFRNNIRMTFMRDMSAVAQVGKTIPVECLMWGSDFPHMVTTWPDSIKVIDEHLHDQPQAIRDAIVIENVRELYRF